MPAVNINEVMAGKNVVKFLFYVMTVRVDEVTVLLNEVIFLLHEMAVPLDEMMELQFFFANLNGKQNEPPGRTNVLTLNQNVLMLSHGLPNG